MPQGSPVNNFLGELDVRYVDGKRWLVMRGFTYRLGSSTGREFVAIPTGFLTDFASMPLGVVYKSPGGKWDKPAVVHDCLYKSARLSVEGAGSRPVTRKDADDIFKEAMKVAGVGAFDRAVIYAGVRLGGWRAWAGHRRNDGADRAA